MKRACLINLDGAVVASCLLAAMAIAYAPAAAPADEAVAATSQKNAAKSEAKPDAEKPAANKKSEGEKRAADKQETEGQIPSRGGSEDKKPEPKRVRIAHLVLESALPESPGQQGPFSELQTDLRKAIGRMDQAAADDRIDGVVLDLRNPSIGYGKVNELRSAIKRIQDAGKTVHAQLEVGTAPGYLIAAACDEVIMPESGFLLLPGVRIEATFYKGLLSMLGVKPDFMHMGDAKGAGETFTRKKWSKPVRENLDAMVGDLYEQMVDTIVRDRPVTEEQARAAIDTALLTATQAKQAGLIDRIAYSDQVRASLGDKHQADQLVYVENYGKKSVDTDFSGPAGVFKLMQAFTGGKTTKGRRAGKKIAVVYAVGPIMTGESEEGLFGGGTVGSTTIVEALSEADRDESTAAIVLRVDSPGGSAVASDLIWRKIQQIDKPVIASMGDVAASGGYYISMGADKIYAEPGTITGSIGVVSGKLAVKGMYDKLGLTTDPISRGQNSGIFGGMRKWSESERVAMTRLMEDIYDQFTTKAASGRDMPIEQIKRLAGGKVYTGRQAKASGLVDEMGTLADAIDAAKELAGLGPDDKVRIETLPEPGDFFETLFGGADKEREVRLTIDGIALPKQVRHSAQRLSAWSRLLEREPVGVFLPYDLTVR